VASDLRFHRVVERLRKATTMRKILTALDGSRTSESILPYLETLLTTQDADVSLVRVIPQELPSKRREATEYVERIAAALRSKGAVVDVHVLAGNPARSIVDMAVRGGFSMILMCSRGRSGLRRLLLGSVAEAVLRLAPIPVLVVHPLSDRTGKLRMKRIVVPLDGSHRSGTILQHVAPLAKATGARLLFVTIVDPRSREDVPADVLARNLFREQKRLHKLGIQTELSIRYGDPVAEILSFGGVQGADLVAFSTHGRTGLERMRLGSVTESVLRQGKFPLLVYRSAGKFVPDPLHAPEIRARRLEKAGAK
jgi:nucleotide-binding universal stress UspA family protein